MSFIENQKQLDKISYLPDDVVNVIYSYVRPKDRLALLKKKYPWDKIKNKLMSIPNKNVNLYKLLTCVKLVRPILCNFLDINGDIMNRCGSTLFVKPIDIRMDLKKNKSSFEYYLTRFVDVVICAIRYYTRMYKDRSYFNYPIHYKYEKVMIQLYAHLLML